MPTSDDPTGRGGTLTRTGAHRDGTGHLITERTAPGRLVRTVWRVHFYAAIFAAPVLLVMALSGLVIMYTEPLTGLLRPAQTRVAAADRPAWDLSVQEAAASAAAPRGSTLFRVVTPKQPDRVTEFYFAAAADGRPYWELGDADIRYVYVDPFRATVTATGQPGDDLVGLANRLHGALNSETLTAGLPSLAHLIDPDGHPDAVDQVPVGDVVIEVSMGWAVVLALSGLYLWWPRRNQKGKSLLVPRWRLRGRLRWRDVHAAAGILALGLLLVFVSTGMPWSEHWGDTLSAANSRLTPGTADPVPSTLAKVGDLDRFGKRIPWDTRENPVPASGTPGSGPGVVPARLPLRDVAAAARVEGMLPGYDIVLPVDEPVSGGPPRYGSYQLANPWPGRIETDNTVHLDQFSGATLARYRSDTSGLIGQATSFGVYVHMGTQFGLADRVVMTAGVLLLLVSIATSLVMWWLRRPLGGLGLPKRPADPRLPWSVAACGLVLAVVYPLWGVSALVVVLADWWVIRRWARLRAVFGLPPVTSGTAP